MGRKKRKPPVSQQWFEKRAEREKKMLADAGTLHEAFTQIRAPDIRHQVESSAQSAHNRPLEHDRDRTHSRGGAPLKTKVDVYSD
jgi:hypothetical protein